MKLFPGEYSVDEKTGVITDKNGRFLGVKHKDITREMIEKATPEQLLRGSSLSETLRFAADTIYIRARPQAAAQDAYWMARDMIAKLGIKMKVRILLNADRPPPQITLFTDHTY